MAAKRDNRRGGRRGGRRKRLSLFTRRLRRGLAMAVAFFIVGSIGLVLSMRWWEPGYSAVMLARLIGERAAQQQAWVGIGEIAPHMALAVVAAEDQQFPRHWGFDTRQIRAALASHRDGGRLRGASTISQQVARNLFLWQGRSYLRKGLEVWFTALMETLWSKRRILEMYLNFAETGERMFGVGAAAQTYFGRGATDLSRSQAALIAAVLPNPLVYKVAEPSAYVHERRDWILRQMRNLGGPAYLDGVLSERARVMGGD